ncbi:MAG: 2-oxoacid:acceptor oxidoreductase family protein [Candidatus Goldiibacteriota bacterium]
MYYDILIAGTGGQGILTTGVFLSKIAILEKKQVTWLPSYGAEKRGGFSFCDVVVSDEEIFSPMVEAPGSFMVFDQRAYDNYKNKITDETLVISNSSLTKIDSDCPGRVLEIPASGMAARLKFPRALNIIMTGAFMHASGVLDEKNAYRIIEEMMRGKNEEILEKNILAYSQGIKAAKEKISQK